MVRYTRLLEEIARRFETRPAGPARPAAPAPDATEETPSGETPSGETPSGEATAGEAPAAPAAEPASAETGFGLRGETKDLDGELLARLFQESSDAEPERAEAPVPARAPVAGGGEGPAGAGEAGPRARKKPFRNHAELLRFASGLIEDMEKELRGQRQRKES